MTTTLLTGLPRSGTTLVCACLNSLPNCVALTEPMSVPLHGNAEQALSEVAAFARATREGILRDGFAPSMSRAGLMVDNTFEEVSHNGNLRRSAAKVAAVKIEKPLTADFNLFIKHPAFFTALAQPLAEAFAFYAIVRHPLAALASWQSVDFPARQGRMPAAEAYAPALRERLEQIADPLARQIALIQWIFQRYRNLPPGHVLTYEALVRDPESVLRPLSGASAAIHHPIREINLKTRYPGVDFGALAQALLPIEADIEPFYPGFAASLRHLPG
ncbi:sulfotransferase [Acidocella sp.]|uniref:sulfotransferase n=1 Tax=Acidocella sp. TaxID=50710 RepID=UPI0026045157|nr:sulfotransferase [Acidocella sp.]MDD2795311.1 sulfotransferase [Acidocella sp.]